MIITLFIENCIGQFRQHISMISLYIILSKQNVYDLAVISLTPTTTAVTESLNLFSVLRVIAKHNRQQLQQVQQKNWKSYEKLRNKKIYYVCESCFVYRSPKWAARGRTDCHNGSAKTKKDTSKKRSLAWSENAFVVQNQF